MAIVQSRGAECGKDEARSLVQEIRAAPRQPITTLSMVTPKADLGFMLITPDFQEANRMEKRLSLSLVADVLTPVYSYLSQPKRRYTASDEDYARTLED